MKKPMLALLFTPTLAFAQMPQTMDQGQMQQMMLRMQEMQSCIQNIDSTQMQALEQRGRAMEAEVRQLCAQGKRSEAQTAAMAFAMESAADPTVQAMKKCGEKMADLMPNLARQQNFPAAEELKSRHVCDGR